MMYAYMLSSILGLIYIFGICVRAAVVDLVGRGPTVPREAGLQTYLGFVLFDLFCRHYRVPIRLQHFSCGWSGHTSAEQISDKLANQPPVRDIK